MSIKIQDGLMNLKDHEVESIIPILLLLKTCQRGYWQDADVNLFII